MSTPDFVAQNSSNFTTVRLYTQSDPYFYSVDNRPLNDLITNLTDMRQNGADSARRAVLLETLMRSSLQRETFNIPSGYTYSASGLLPTQPNANQIRINPGSVLLQEALTVLLTTTVYKQAMLLAPVDFNIPAPGTAGQSLVYTIEGTLTDLSSANMAASALPYLDAGNTYLPSTLLNKELVLSLKTGAAAATGSEVPAATTGGKFPLYNITTINGTSAIRIWAHANSPYFKGITNMCELDVPSSGGAPLLMYNDTVSWTLNNATTTAVSVRVPMDKLNPYKDIRVKLITSPNTTGLNMALRLKYAGHSAANSDLLTTARTVTATEAIAVSAANAGVQVNTMTGVVPNSAFSGMVSNTWSVNRDRLTLLVERLGSDALDTSTSDVNLLQVILLQ